MTREGKREIKIPWFKISRLQIFFFFFQPHLRWAYQDLPRTEHSRPRAASPILGITFRGSSRNPLETVRVLRSASRYMHGYLFRADEYQFVDRVLRSTV
jgi:hypothetical protein